MQPDALLRSFHKTAGFPGLPPGWVVEAETFENSDRCGRLFALFLRKTEVPGLRRALVVLHGQGEHSGRYLHFPHYLDGAVTDICLMDMRGHGRSEGLRGHIDRFDDYMGDLATFVGFARERLSSLYGAAPELHLLGHSMGGLIVLRLLALRPELRFASATVSAPLLGLKMAVPGYKKALAYGLSSVWGSLQLASELDPALLSRDPHVQEAYAKDLLVHSKATPRFFTEMQKAMADTLRQVSGLEVPLLLQVPLADGIVDSDVTLAYARAISDERKELQTYPEFRHESYNEVGKEKPFEDLKRWIIQHSSKVN